MRFDCGQSLDCFNSVKEQRTEETVLISLTLCLLDSLVESLECLCRQLADLRRSRSLDVDMVEVGI